MQKSIQGKHCNCLFFTRKKFTFQWIPADQFSEHFICGSNQSLVFLGLIGVSIHSFTNWLKRASPDHCYHIPTGPQCPVWRVHISGVKKAVDQQSVEWIGGGWSLFSHLPGPFMLKILPAYLTKMKWIITLLQPDNIWYTYYSHSTKISPYIRVIQPQLFLRIGWLGVRVAPGALFF